MKSSIKRVMCLILILGIFFCLSACGSEGEKSDSNNSVIKQNATGRYELEKIEYADGTTVSGEVLQYSEEVMGDMYVELFSDGSAQLALFGRITDMEFSAEKIWEPDFAMNSYAFSVKNGRVTLEKNDDTYIFVKK